MGIFTAPRRIADTPRPRLIIGLLAGLSLLVVALMWQAYVTMRSHDQAATGVLRDYTQLAIDEYTRRTMATVGYYGYFTLVNEYRAYARDIAAFPLGIPRPDEGTQAASARELIAVVFKVRVADEITETAPDVDAALRDYISRRSLAFANEPAPESGYIVDHPVIGGRVKTLVLSRIDDAGLVFGFEVDAIAAANWLQQTFLERPLLPASLSKGEVGNEHIFLRHSDAAGVTLFESGADIDRSPEVTRPLGDDYGGVFRGHAIAAAVDKRMADSLIIGGLPRSRLPVLLTILLLTIALMAGTVRQLRREYALMELRSSFVAEVSHELRTPLTQIRMFTETLLLGRFRTSGDRHRALEIISRESQRLTNLVENVLRFSQPTDDRRLDITNRSLAPIVDAIIAEFGPLAAAADMTIEFDPSDDDTASVDDDAVRQIVLNLLDNAVKYGPAGQLIRVSLDGDDGAVLLRVRDQGPGVPAADRKRIFDPYQRLTREKASAVAGTGIGLAIVASLAQEMGGDAYVEVDADSGACFVVSFRRGATQ